MFTTNFGDLLTKLGVSKRFQPAIDTVVHEESESEVQNIQILQGNLKNSISFFKKYDFLPDQGVYQRFPLIWTQLGGNSSYKPPGASYTAQGL